MNFAVFIINSVTTWRKMNEFVSVCSNGKPASDLEDFRKFSVKEIQGILKHEHENIGNKRTFW